MYTTVGWLQSVDPAGVFVQLSALADQHVRVTGPDIQCPLLNQVLALSGGAESTVAPTMRFISPSQRRKTSTSLAPLNTASALAVEPASPVAMVDLRNNPIPLVVGEQLNAELLSNPAAAQVQWMFAFLGDVSPVAPAGQMFTVRATSATPLVLNSWTNVAIVLAEDLPRGRYALVGLLPISTGMIAARAVFVGGGWRSGVMGNDSVSDIGSTLFRYGGMGIMGEFEDTDPPTIDAVSISSDATQEYFLDLIQLRDGPT